jgi:hypothetical protein
MAFPNNQINTSNLDSDARSPSQARIDLFNAVVALNTIIDGANDPNGVCVLSANGSIDGSQIPLTVNPTGTLVLAPSSGVVKIQDVLRLQTQTTEQVKSLTGTVGDIVYTVDGDGGAPCLAVYDGSAWRVLRFNTDIGDVSAELSASVKIDCDAEVIPPSLGFPVP